MEGFDYQAVTEILDLPKNHNIAVMIPIGYRDASESPRPKVRFAKEQLFTEMK